MTAPSLPELKNYLRYESGDTSQDTALGIILGGAQRWVENFTGHILVQRVVTESPLAFGASFLPLRWKPYVPSDDDGLVISYLDSAYGDQTFEAFSVYQALGGWRVAPTSEWPSAVKAITLTYLAGYEDVYDIPEDLMLAVALLAGMTDEERGDQSSQGWKSLYNLLEQYRMPVLA